ncbi:Phosphate transport system permease protein PstC [Rubrobacter xylanophilus DSM 9941]|uniref:Phosphate transport system permease protein n=1 Tax=Rubrobacter xylanophilus TaxID=49319 RepID=A0A510HEA3_9ACTN|nr:phosphate ABC transporter permease subunit PstC [Rubrobacter xylanophilus]QYJ17020.1 Phosphate transport system permease protein PstC [Rubrobacter xylanophilus DSM 9941]BBL78244.1 phosphate transport system permease protein PstC [Rubrobacter xylanophilus]
MNPLKRLRRGNPGDALFGVVAVLFGLSILAIMAGIIFQLWIQSSAARQEFGWSFLWSTEYDPQAEEYGALVFVYGTLVTAAIAILLAGPVGVGIAAYLVEIAPPRLNRFVGFMVELLAAIPSIVYGIWGFFVLAPFLREYVVPVIQASPLGWLPIFGGTFFGPTVFTASIVLAVMILPTVAAVSRDVIGAVPRDQREGMLALGATRWEMFRWAVLPYARNGVLGAIILGLGRAAGETMAVTFIIGNKPQIFTSLFDQGATIASQIAAQFPEAGGILLSVLIELGLVLFVITIIINVGARLLVYLLSGAPKGGVRV